MAYNGSGIWNRLYNWTNDAQNGIKIRADRMDAEFNDMCSNGLSKVITRDGQGVPTANLPMGGFKHTGVADPTATDQYLTVNQAQQGSSSLLSGSFTPIDASGAGLTFSTALGIYRRTPGGVHISMKIVFPSTADSSVVKIGALPFTASSSALSFFPITAHPVGGGTPAAVGLVIQNDTKMQLNTATGTGVTNATMSTNTLYVNGVYPI